MPDSFAVSDRTRVVREANRAVYDREAIYKILDEGFVCHVGFSAEGQPFVIPTMFARVGDAIYFHGSAASRMLRGAAGGLPVCVTVTLLDGLVLARSVFNHSMNYRSVVALGTATLIGDPTEKLAALRAFTEKLIPGRWDDARQPNEQELKATTLMGMEMETVSGKIRDKHVADEEEDYEAVPAWSALYPITLTGPIAPVSTSRAARFLIPLYSEDLSQISNDDALTPPGASQPFASRRQATR